MNGTLVLEQPQSAFIPEKDIDAQVRRLWETLDFGESVDEDTLTQIYAGKLPLPKRAMGWFAVPHWRALAPLHEDATKYVRRAVNIKTDMRLAFERRSSEEVKQVTDILRKIRLRQNGANMLILPAKFVTKKEFVSDSSSDTEFNLGTVEYGAMLLAHVPVEGNWFSAVGFNPYV